MRERREFLKIALAVAGASVGKTTLVSARMASRRPMEGTGMDSIRLFLCGDVMPGRGIDQILPHPSPPILYESYVRDARRYLELAEQASGEIPRRVAFDYVWGDVLEVLAQHQPDARIVNLETSITRSGEPWPKGINYRLHPDNVPCLTAAGIDCCVLANNHVLDWGHGGLIETIGILQRSGIRSAGAGGDLEQAQAPAILPLADGTRVLVFAGAAGDSGVPAAWGASATRPGVVRLPDLSAKTVTQIARRVRRHKRAGDRVVFSVHWGDNWGYAVPDSHQAFAHGLVEEAGIDVVHGHSSHHVKAVEVHGGRLILYGCGDFLNDYEGIEGLEDFRGDLGLMYLPSIDRATGCLHELRLVPTKIRKFRVERADGGDSRKLFEILQREYERFDCGVQARDDGSFALLWGG